MFDLPFVVKPKTPKGIRSKSFRFFAMCTLATFFICIFIALSPISSDECKCSRPDNKADLNRIEKTSNLLKGKHRLAVLVPFRDRFEELLQFVPHMNNFLSRQNVDFEIYILNQIDNYRFNRAALINVGFLLSRDECDYMAIHDVDLLPINPELSYTYRSQKGPFHIASPELHPRYHYETFVGGILLIKREEYKIVNGMSNKYWGWGLEDDEFYVRLKEAKLNISRPINISTGTDNTFLHIHDRVKRKRDMTKCFNQREVTRRRDRQTGLRDVQYEVDSKRKLVIDDDNSATIFNIKLKCDRNLTPWCFCDDLKTNGAQNANGKNVEKVSGSQPANIGDTVIVPNIRKTVKPKTKRKK